MNWRKYDQEMGTNMNSEAGNKMQPTFEMNKKGILEIVDEFDCQQEIDSHLEETKIEPQILQAKLIGRTLSKEQTGAYVDLTPLGHDFVERQQNAENSDAIIKAAYAEIMKKEEAEKAKQDAAAQQKVDTPADTSQVTTPAQQIEGGTK